MGTRASLQKRIEAALSALVGMPIWDACRALNMEMFDIGDRVEVVNRRKETVEVGTYRLHVQAPWRILGPKGIVVGSVDAHYPPSDREGDESFDPNNDRSSCEERVRAWLDKHRRRPVAIRSVAADEWGGFRLVLAGGYTLEVVPASSHPHYEHWRLLGPGAEGPPHFVVVGRKVQR
jgi:hypothetical protein